MTAETKLAELIRKSKPISKPFKGKRNTIEKFWNKVQIGKENDCWPWKGKPNVHGYGRFGLNRKMYMAHKLSFILMGGKFTKHKNYGCHKCNNPICVNPNHVKAGTHEENMRDKSFTICQKGENAVCVKLTERQVRKIRKLLSSGMFARVIAKRYKVHEQTIYFIKHKRNWGWLKD